MRENSNAPVSLSASIFDVPSGKQMVVTGAGAAARGAYEAGVGLVTTYPGSPITEAFELLASPKNTSSPICRISINEHVAFHKALGFSLAGGRSFITMKHVGFNVASDPAHYAGFTQVRGGMVILVGTDPGAFCSTGEFDFRFYSLHTLLPLLEPTSAQDILFSVQTAFKWSEEDQIPYVVAVPAGACYGIEGVTTGEVRPKLHGNFFEKNPSLTNVGFQAVINHKNLLDKLDLIAKKSEGRKMVRIYGSGNEGIVVTSGVHLSRVLEAIEILGISTRIRVFSSLLSYPFPVHSLLPFFPETKRVVFVEDLGGFLETSLSRFFISPNGPREIHGKNVFPAFGSLDLRTILDGLAKVFDVSAPPHGTETRLPSREGTFCPGCAYRPFFHVLNEFLGETGVLGGDIGCSSLPPHFSSWLTCMNSGTSIAAGVSLAVEGRQQVVSLIGDSTLLHSGLQTIIESAINDSDQTCFILYNHWTAMTGHQETPLTPRSTSGKSIPHLDIEKILTALGVREIIHVDPYRLNNFRALLKRILPQKGFRVVLVERECSLQARRRSQNPGWRNKFYLEPERCQECGLCYEKLCCPAIVKTQSGACSIDSVLCAQCGVCEQVCPNNAILSVQTKHK